MNVGLEKPVSKSMLKQRILTALILAPILLAIVIYGDAGYFSALVFLIQSAATYEWLKINQLNSFLAFMNAVVLSLFTVYILGQFTFLPVVMVMLYGLTWLLTVIWLLNHRWGYENSLFQLGFKSILGVLAIMLFGLAMNQLYSFEMGHWWTLVLFLLIWVADIGAYISGKTMGRHKLAINISPGKTWEGVIGAQIFVAIYAVVVSFLMDVDTLKTLVVMLPIALFSVVGDLAASLGKRQAHVKDSSNLLPGHGGFIDRFDSLIAAAPLFELLLGFL